MVAVFLVALWLRVDTVFGVHTEGDEQLYTALVQQLEAGKGYTLQGHPILREAWVVREQYDRPLFYHPPGGIALFWVLHHFFGSHGMGLAQLVSFSIFFWGMVALARQVLREWSILAAVVVSGLAAFTPIVAHVHTHYWLDGPQVALTTAGAALYLHSLRRRRWGWMVAAGALLAWACLTKLNAVLVLPAVFALGWAIDPDRSFRRLLAPAAIVAGIVAIALLPWMWVQWRVFGEIFPSWSGKPAADLIATNPYVRFVTVVRGPWTYFRLLPQATATLIPALIALVWLWKDKRSHCTEIVLCAWILGILLIHVALGYVGYSKLLRYVILVVPATILLFALAVEGAVARIRVQKSRRVAAAFLALASVAFAVEVTLGVVYIEVYPMQALIALYPDMQMYRSMILSME